MAGSCPVTTLRLAARLPNWESIMIMCCTKCWACLRNEIDSLQQEELIGNTPEGGGRPSTVPLERQVELGWTVELHEEY